MMARAPVKQTARLREICRQNPLQSRQKNAATPVAPVCQNTPAAAVQGQGRKPLRGLAQRPKAICRSMVGKRAMRRAVTATIRGYFRHIDAATPSAHPPVLGKAHGVFHILRKTLCAGAPDAGQCWPRIGCPCSGTACNPFAAWLAAAAGFPRHADPWAFARRWGLSADWPTYRAIPSVLNLSPRRPSPRIGCFLLAALRPCSTAPTIHARSKPAPAAPFRGCGRRGVS